MAELVAQVALFIESIVAWVGYPGIVLLMLLEYLFPPIPAGSAIPFAGFLVARGEMNFLLAWGAGVFGATLGALGLYHVGRWANEPVVRAFLRRYGKYLTLSEADLDRALALFGRYGEGLVFLGRVLPLPMVGMLVSITAGMQRMSRLRFAFFTAVGAALMIGAMLLLGVILGENWGAILAFTQQYEPYLWALVFAAALLILAIYLLRLRAAWHSIRQTPVLKVDRHPDAPA